MDSITVSIDPPQRIVAVIEGDGDSVTVVTAQPDVVLIMALGEQGLPGPRGPSGPQGDRGDPGPPGDPSMIWTSTNW